VVLGFAGKYPNQSGYWDGRVGTTLMILLKTKVFDHQTSDFGDDLNI